MAQRFIKSAMRFFNASAPTGANDYRMLTDYLSKNKTFQQVALNVNENVESVKAYCRNEWNIDLGVKKLENKKKPTKKK